MAYAQSFDTSTPLGSESPTQGDDRIRELKAGIQERLAYDHYFPASSGTGDTVAGAHAQVTFKETISAPLSVDTGQAMLAVIDVGGREELHFVADSWTGAERQLTSNGQINIEPDDLAVNTLIDDVTIGLNGSNLLYVKNAGIDTDQIADGAVGTDQLADGAVTKDKMAATAFRMRAFGSFAGTDSNPITPSASEGITATITKNATGDYSVTFDTPLSHSNYVVAVSAKKAASGTAGRFAMVHDQDATGFSIRVSRYSDDLELADSPLVSFAVFSLTA